jgi:hypothetical protein
MVSNFERRITTQLKSWLSAVGIGFKDTTGGLVVTSKDGASIPLTVVVKGTQVPPGSIPVQAKDFTSRNLTTSLEAFGGLQEALGYTPPKLPVDRGPAPSRKAHFSDDFDLVVMRHMDFRRSPNPTNAELKSFQSVIDKAVWWFYKKNVTTCADMGLEVEDLKSYGMQWTCNYLGLYRSELGRAEDEKNLCQFLKQRFIEFREQLDRKARNVLPMLDDAYIAMHGRPYEYTNKGEWFSTDPEVDAPWEIPGTPEEAHDETVTQREHSKKAAAQVLAERLASMPHDEMVTTLSDAVANDRIHLDARRAASKKLQMHAKKCTECSETEFPRAPGDGSVPNNLPIQDEEGKVFGSAKEAADAHGVYPSNVRAVLSGRYKHTGGHVFKYVQPSA